MAKVATVAGAGIACLPGHIYMSSIVDRRHCPILEGQLEILPVQPPCVVFL